MSNIINLCLYLPHCWICVLIGDFYESVCYTLVRDTDPVILHCVLNILFAVCAHRRMFLFSEISFHVNKLRCSRLEEHIKRKWLQPATLRHTLCASWPMCVSVDMLPVCPQIMSCQLQCCCWLLSGARETLLEC